MWLLYFFHLFIHFIIQLYLDFFVPEYYIDGVSLASLAMSSGPTSALPSVGIGEVMELGLRIVITGDLICQPNYVKTQILENIPPTRAYSPSGTILELRIVGEWA